LHEPKRAGDEVGKMNCERCQERLLDDLYDLLDPGERGDLGAHLESCLMCQEAKAALAGRQALLAEAARESFANVRFQPPAETPRHAGEPTLAFTPVPRRQRGFSWVRVAVAASIIVVVLGGGAMGVKGWFDHRSAISLAEAKIKQSTSDIEKQNAELEKHRQKTREEIKEIQEQINRLFSDWKTDAVKVREQQAKQPVQVKLQGPRGGRGGAPYSFNLDIVNNPQAPPSQVETVRNQAVQQNLRAQVNVYDRANNRQVYQQNYSNLMATNSIALPQSVPFLPNQELDLEVVVEDETGKLVKIREQLNLTTTEYLSHLATDRPMYRPGEVVRFRSLTLERFSLKPAGEDLHVIYTVTGPNGQELYKLEGGNQLFREDMAPPQERFPVIDGPDGKPLRGLGAGEYYLPPDLPGGTYTLTLSEAKDRFAPEKRTFLVNQWQQPRMNKELVFSRSSYGAGDPVEVQARATRVEGGAALAQQPVKATAIVDGRNLATQNLVTDAEGRVKFAFSLPTAENVPSGRGTVSIEFNDGAGPEPIVRPIPIVLGKLFVEFYPEGGDLIEGVPNRVYVQARTTLGKPAELKGRIVDQTGAEVAEVTTLHDDQEPALNQGQGAFTFTPQMGNRYELKIDTPIGIESKHPLPAAKGDGVVLHLPRPIADEALDIEVTSVSRARKLLVGAYCRGKLIDQRPVLAPANKPVTVALRTAPEIGGVYRVTVFEMLDRQDGPGLDGPALLPRAERLTFRHRAQKLNVAVDGIDKVYTPGEKVQLNFKSRNEKGLQTAAVALVSVVDLSVLKLADDKTHRAMPTHFLLTSEVRKPEDLENADALLGSHPQAETALDLLLGTQGWRRFAEQKPIEFQRKQPKEAQRLLLALAQQDQKRDPAAQVVAEKVDKKYAEQAKQLIAKLNETEAIELGTPEQVQTLNVLQSSNQAARDELHRSEAQLIQYQRMFSQFVIGVVICGLLLLGVSALVLGVRRLGQGRSALAAFATGTCVLAFLLLGSLLGTFFLIGNKGEMPVAFGVAENRAVPDDAVVMALPAPAPPMAAPDRFGQAPPANMEAKADAAPLDAQDDQMLRDVAVKMRALPAPVPMMGMEGGGVPAPPGMLAQEQPFGNAQFFQDGQMQLQAGLMAGGEPFGGQGDPERQLRLQGRFRELFRQRLGREIDLPPELPMLVARQYAHVNQQESSPDNVRRDFTETLLWQPALVLADGTAQVSFDLSDAATRFQVTVVSHSLDGRLGANTYEIAARLPFSVEPKVPFEIASTDKVIIPVAIKNDTAQSGGADIALRVKNLKTQDALTRHLPLSPKERSRAYFALEPAVSQGTATVMARGDFTVQPYGTDSVERSFTIVPDGFPVEGGVSGVLEKAAVHTLNLPPTWNAGTMKCEVQVFPSMLSTLQKGLDGLLQEPNGCFEQSSSSNYPNVMILSYLQEAGVASPAAEQRSRRLLESGYQKLTSFECLDPKQQQAKRGYEWFGQTAPPHEALTAYGLMQFKDMAKVYPVEVAMLDRTRSYLLGQRDGKGGFKRNARALDSFGRAPDNVTNAYIVWALTESGVKEDLTPEMTALAKQAQASKDAYFLSLVALGHINRGQTKEGIDILKKLRDLQEPDGHLQSKGTSITGSRGRDLYIETTSLAVLGWLKANRPDEFFKNVHQAVEWISKARDGGGSFGATQSTILALKALIAYTRDNKSKAEGGKLTVSLDGNQVGETVFSASVAEPVAVTIPEGLLKPGANKVEVQITGKNEFPYTLAWSCRAPQPASAEDAPVRVTAKLAQTDVREGDTVKLHAKVENKSGKGQGMTVAILGLPAGLAVPEDAKQLIEMAKLRDNGAQPGLISAWELKGRELVLYWRDLAPDAKIDVELDLICRLPGTYHGPASRAYLYYGADRKHWIEPLRIQIAPQQVE
jgi:alpha-2-macroglobulin-like protein